MPPKCNFDELENELENDHLNGASLPFCSSALAMDNEDISVKPN